MHRPDEGELCVGGRPVRVSTPLDARRAGVETVYQDLAVADDLSVVANLYLRREILRVSHNMPRVLEIADRVEVLRLGRRVARFSSSAVTTDELVAAMTGARTAESEPG